VVPPWLRQHAGVTQFAITGIPDADYWDSSAQPLFRGQASSVSCTSKVGDAPVGIMKGFHLALPLLGTRPFSLTG
jgi:hypothetical protein